MNERKLLEGLRDVGHPHIIELLTSFERESELGMLFPLATYDLDKYMRQTPPPVNDSYVSWVLNQLLGLTDALCKIHEYDGGYSSSPRDSRGYHRDLKPQNILFFQDPAMPQLQGIFRISDFGLGKFRANERNATISRTATRTDNAKWGTPMYAPPELEFEDAPSNLYDMWSLGCIFLEFLTWIQLGSEGRNAITDKIQKFFVKGRYGDFDVHHEVAELIKELRRENSNMVLKEILETVVNRLLVWDPQGRWTSSQLYGHLRKIEEQKDSVSSIQDSPWHPKIFSRFRWHDNGEESEYDRNVNLSMGQRRPFMLGPRLGQSKAVVYKIFCKGQLFALKLIESTTGGATITAAANEIGILSRLDHGHIVQFVGSYRKPLDKQRLEIGIILYPAAECNLEQFLKRIADHDLEDNKEALRTFFGCLSRIVRLLHVDESVKHKDIKPQNILVNERIVFFSDFGISRYFPDGNSVTSGPSRHTRRYSAPEVVKSDKRGRRADIFSLGCVFLEIITVISGHRVRELSAYLNENEEQRNYFENAAKVRSWIEEKLAKVLSPPDSGILSTIVKMLDHNPEKRPDAEEVVQTMETLFTHACHVCS
ncbi:hypothetical protein RRF57_010893 [Xylaria bambusicola]|uniref:Protein kinase domain-containing protein n=1 Tax=Xylaria bambusicola TaxID=326684 RepID=A0AAN7ZCT6_9PEZI